MTQQTTDGLSGREIFLGILGLRPTRYIKWLTTAYVAISVISIFSFAIGVASLSFLEVSHAQWWGIFTSIVLFDTPYSLVGLLSSIFLLGFIDSEVREQDRGKRTTVFLFCTIASAFIANFLWYLLPASRTTTSFGSSQIDYAADAFLVVYAVSNLLHSVSPFDDRRRRSSKVNLPRDSVLRKTWLLKNVVILVSMLLVTFVIPPTILQYQAGVNTFVHAAAFIAAILIAVVYELLSTF